MKPGTKVRVVGINGSLNGYEGVVIDPDAFIAEWGMDGLSTDDRWTILVDLGFDDPEVYWFAEDELEIVE